MEGADPGPSGFKTSALSAGMGELGLPKKTSLERSSLCQSPSEKKPKS